MLLGLLLVMSAATADESGLDVLDLFGVFFECPMESSFDLAADGSVCVPIVLAQPVQEEDESRSPNEIEESNMFDSVEVLDLETAQQCALAENPSLQAVAEQVTQTQQLVRQARSLYFPQIDVGYSVSRTDMPDSLDKSDELDDLLGRQRKVRRSESTFDFDAWGAGTQLPALLTPFQDAFALFFRIQNDLTRIFGDAEAQSQLFEEQFAFKEKVDQYSLSVTAGYLLFNGFSRKCSYAMARFGRQETEAAEREARRLLLGGVAQAFYSALLARENMRTAEADEDFNLRLLEDAKARRERGKGSTNDILNFEIRARAARAGLLMVEGEYEGARIALASLMGVPNAFLPERVTFPELASETPEEMARPDADAMIARAFECRPGIEQKEYSVKRARAAVRQRYGDFYPQVSLFASSEARLADESHFDKEDFATTVGVNISYNIFSGGRHMARVAEAKHARRQAEYRLTDEEIKVATEVQQVLLKLRISQEQLVLARTTAEYVEKNRDLVKKAYDAGKVSLALLNQSQRDLVEAQAKLNLARVSLKQSWYELRTATGEILLDFEGNE